MLITCNRILLPYADEDDPLLRRAREDAPREHVKRRRLLFDLADVEKFTEHEDRRFVVLYFYASDPLIVDHPYEELEKAYRELHARDDEEDEDDTTFRYFIPAN